MAAFANEVRTLKCSHILAAPLADLWLFEIDNILAAISRSVIRNLQVMRSI